MSLPMPPNPQAGPPSGASPHPPVDPSFDPPVNPPVNPSVDLLSEPSIDPPPGSLPRRFEESRLSRPLESSFERVLPRSRIQLDSSLRRWFGRNLGLWRSRRTYFFPDDESVRVDMLLRVESFREPVEGEAAYRFTWWPEKEYDFFERQPRYSREGTMEAYLCGHQLQIGRAHV